MSKWIIQKKFDRELKLNKSTLLAGLPGIGSVGKIAIDFIIDELKPKLLYKIYSHNFPHSVIISDDNLVDLPCVRIHHLKVNSQDLLLLSGDAQPTEERASYEFAEKILDIVGSFGCREVLTLGGIGLSGEPQKSKVFGTATDSDTLKKYKGLTRGVNFQIDGKVGTIVGAAGLLIGLAPLRGGHGASLLVETFCHPYHVGMREAKTLLAVIDKMFGLGLDLDKLDREIEESEKGLLKAKRRRETKSQTLLRKLKSQLKEKDISYIG